MRASKEIQAAGAVVHRGHGPHQRIALVHRPRYDDWTIPKGKLDPGECLPQTAVRELDEETGLTVRLGSPLGRRRYRTSKGPKSVAYWAAQVVHERHREPDHEVDAVAWVSAVEARGMLSYDDDREVLERFLATPPTTPLIIVRHAKAMERSHWSGRDAARPLTAKGRQQSLDLIPLLRAFGVAEVVSSSSNRCVSTLLPYAVSQRLTIDRRGQLSEEEGTDDPEGVMRLMHELRRRVVATGVPLAVCGHRPVLPHMLAGMGLPDTPLRKGEAVPVHLTADDVVESVEHFRPQK